MTGPIARLKWLLPDREMNLPIVRGPFRGGVFRAHPRSSLRKVFGLYEHELNSWLRIVTFSDAGLNLAQIDQRPLPLLSREARDAANWWMVTDVNDLL